MHMQDKKQLQDTRNSNVKQLPVKLNMNKYDITKGQNDLPNFRSMESIPGKRKKWNQETAPI